MVTDEPRIVDYVRQKVLIDSGASEHMVGDPAFIDAAKPYCANVILANSAVISCTQRGIMRVKFYSQLHDRHFTVALVDTLVVPGLRNPLVSANRLSDSGHMVLFKGDHVILTLCADEPNPLMLHLSRPFHYDETASSHYTVVHHTKPDDHFEIPHEHLVHACRVLADNHQPNHHHHLITNQHPESINGEEEQTMLAEAFNTSVRLNESPVKASTPTKVPTTTPITLETLHNRMGHIPINVLLAANDAKVWKSINIQWEPDSFCIGCKIGAIKASNRGKAQVSSPSKPGETIHLDIIYNPVKTGLTPSSYYPYYLGVTDAFSHSYFLIGMTKIDSAAVITAIEHWAVQFRPHIDYTINDLKEIFSDAGSQFKSEYLTEWGRTYPRLIVARTAAPHHQSTNGLTENRWKNTRLRCQKMLTHARLDARFFDCCITHAALITNLSPLRNLTITNNEGVTSPTTPFELYFGSKPDIRRLRTWGCPVIFKAYHRGNLHDKNIIQRGVRGIFVGFPVNQAGYLLWVDQVGQFVVSADVSFDENFLSVLAYNKLPFHDALPVLAPETTSIDNSMPVAHTGPPFVSADDCDPTVPWVPYTALPPLYKAGNPIIDDFHHVDPLSEEGSTLHDDLHRPISPDSTQQPPNVSNNIANEPSNDSSHSNSSNASTSIHEDDYNVISNDDLMDMVLEDNDLDLQSVASFEVPHVDDINNDDDNNNNTPQTEEGYLLPRPRRSQRIRNQRTAGTQPFHHRYNDSYINAITTHASIPTACAAESIAAIKESLINIDIIDSPGADPTPFMPEPTTVRQMLREPPSIQAAWKKAFIKEVHGIVVTHQAVEPVSQSEPSSIVPVKVVFKCKTNKHGGIDKLKCRIVVRGDLHDPQDPMDSWNPHATWPALRILLAFCAYHHIFPSQAEFRDGLSTG
jgi:hypothetical protein